MQIRDPSELWNACIYSVVEALGSKQSSIVCLLFLLLFLVLVLFLGHFLVLVRLRERL